MGRRANKMPDLERLGQLFRRYPDILAVYLFGSVASGKAYRERNRRVALELSVVKHRAKKLELLTDLARQGFCDVDLIFLDTDDIVLQYEAVRQNRLVYQAEDFDRGATYSRVVRQYLDFLPYLKVQREAYKKRVLGDQG